MFVRHTRTLARIEYDAQMPDYLGVMAVEPEVEAIELGHTDHTYDTLRREVEAHCSAWPGVVRVLFTSPWELDSYGVFIVEAGEVEEEFSKFSLHADELVDPSATTDDRKLSLTCDASEFDDAFAAANEDEASSFEGEALEVPYRWKAAKRLLVLMALVAPRLAESARMLVAIRGSPARLTVDREKGVALDPVFHWFDDGPARAMVQKLSKPVRAEKTGPVTGAGVAVVSDMLLERGDPLGAALARPALGKTPLTSGSAQARSLKATDASTNELLATLEAPENEGERFETLRLEMMLSLAQQKPLHEATLPLLLRRLVLESVRARSSIYSLLSRLDDARASAVLASAFETDTANARFIDGVIWRQPRTVELLVNRMLSAWNENPALAKRIVALLQKEFIEVRAGQLPGAPAALLADLGSLVKP